ncbi:V-type proton ATPase subunit C [Camellia lanceoleosa]|uniref:V-type proton ATPase subunit C n=1 Tax=Camellia lanceoleosa TaxID=1840588 RepID=A0ACC0F0I0_9ERIC|nr:V-type proton ATPase subunit C [Camellia lanceoleosa]
MVLPNNNIHLHLAVCDLSNLVKPQDIIITEHLTTFLAIVPKYSQKDWLSSYKTLTAYVVKIPLLSPEYALYTVTLFSCDADNFRIKARDRGFQVSAFLCIAYLILLVIRIRDFEYNPETQESRKQELEKLMQDQETLSKLSLQWCYAAMGRIYLTGSFLYACSTQYVLTC